MTFVCLVLYVTFATICFIFLDDNMKRDGAVLVSYPLSPLFLIYQITYKNSKKALVQHEFNNRWRGFYPVKNFLRPSFYLNSYHVVLANKYCVLAFENSADNYNIYSYYLYDKKTDNCIKLKIPFEIERYFEQKIIETFNFETTYKDIVEMISKDMCIPPNSHTSSGICRYKYTSINNMSVAELMLIPGINLGKANKIAKRIRNKNFKNCEEFIQFAELDKDDADFIKEFFKYEMTCNIKKLT